MTHNTFPKAEKLCGKIRTAALYKEGRRFVSYPLRVTYQHLPDNSQPPQVLIWAPKSLFKHAVDRNHLRRLMREAYRLNAAPLRDFCLANHCSFHIAFNYMDRQPLPYDRIAAATAKAIRKILAQQPGAQPAQPSAEP